MKSIGGFGYEGPLFGVATGDLFDGGGACGAGAVRKLTASGALFYRRVKEAVVSAQTAIPISTVQNSAVLIGAVCGGIASRGYGTLRNAEAIRTSGGKYPSSPGLDAELHTKEVNDACIGLGWRIQQRPYRGSHLGRLTTKRACGQW